MKRLLCFAIGGLRHVQTLSVALLSRRERRRVVALVRVLRAAAGHMQTGGLPALMAHLEASSSFQADQSTIEQAIRQADAVAAFARLMPFKDCMRRASLRYHVMRAAGQPAVMVIGVRRTQAKSGIIGHAWIELDGQVFRETGHQHAEMAVMYRYPDSGSG